MESLFDLLYRTADGAFAVDRRKRVVFWNDGARRILGFDADTACDRRCFELLQGQDEDGRPFCDRRCEAFRAAKTGVPPVAFDVRVKTVDGAKKWINVSTLLLPSQWSDSSLLVHLFRDTDPPSEPRLRRRARKSKAYPAAPPPGELLTVRETEVLRMLAAGASTESIATRLQIGKSTVRTHVEHILEKLRVHSRLEAVAAVFHRGGPTRE